MNWNQLSPYALGESRTFEALPHLVVYLHNGSDNEKRLAASALMKLIESNVNCYSAIPFLVKNLTNEKPQVRQYTLKALNQLNLSKDYQSVILRVLKQDDKEYNREIAAEILMKLESGNTSLDSNSSSLASNDVLPLPEEDDSEVINTKVEHGFVYFLKEDFSGRIKIGKTKDITQRLDTFNVKLPFNVTLIHQIESQNHHYTEKLFHIHFRAKQSNGEWFSLNDNDIEWIQSGNYTKRIKDSLTYSYVSKNKSKQHLISGGQKTFLSNLLANHSLMLTKPLTQFTATEADVLIGYLYKGTPLTNECRGLIAIRSNNQQSV